MTREEAIKIFQVMKKILSIPNSNAARTIEAIDMAIEALSAEHKHCWDCKHYEPKYNVCHAPEVVKQVTSKLKKPCDSLLTEESNGSKEHKSKLDLISRQDVIEALSRSSIYAWSIEQDQTAHNWALNIIKALPSADAEPTVIRSRTLLPTKDFKEWAKRIKEVNPNAVVIPCDAEVVSADADVVRCKDCKYSFYDKDYESYNCRKHEYVECFDADDYCSWGERND